ncbi:uncharacterized protein LOC135696234 isoform X2 [Rhopilema esculentum]|uniref:uncharacterized protein LOC135696234 isoform X2 n=1 Tax=Rhopilema esculentum TaxID=499914 RepID=UPI0031E37C62
MPCKMILNGALLLLSVSATLCANWADTARRAVEEQAKENENIRQELVRLGRQMMLQQFFTEERVRSEGGSGLKQIRIHNVGLKNYFSATHSGNSMAAVHDHANNIRTVGMGEFVAVLNGVEFRTRHNDYRLYMASNDKKYHGSQDIPFPDVPPEVLQHSKIEDQTKEMREWFKAWRDQDHSTRDYRKYFKPVLCYLEGAWTRPGNSIDEPFHSDRHFVDAKNWFDLQEKFRFTSYTGSKSILENLPFLPTTIMRYVNETIPVLAQWNYRINCHPLKKEVPLSKFKLVDDVANRMRYKRSHHQYLHSRAARFSLDDSGQDRPTTRSFLDDLMEEIPGKDNYAADLKDIGFNAEGATLDPVTGKVKNVGFYHRLYKVARRDAMGLSLVHRGFSDENMFCAMSSQKEVAGLEVPNPKKCRWVIPPGGAWRDRKRVCDMIHQKWTWAIPLEVIYLTPLQKWNPHNIEYKGDANSAPGKTVTADKRYGQCGKDLNDTSTAHNGTNSRAYYLTPASFFTGTEQNTDAADTSGRYGKCILDRQGKKHRLMASGVRIFLPNIPGVGILRTRYPIMPVHGEGGSVWKELNALKEIVMNPKAHERMLWDSDVKTATDSEWEMSPSRIGAEHTHTVLLTPDEMSQLKGGRELQVTTSLANGHQHFLNIRWHSTKKIVYYTRCSGQSICRDRHATDFSALNTDPSS